jgi:deoxyribodipyrimidine photo-lyase
MVAEDVAGSRLMLELTAKLRVGHAQRRDLIEAVTVAFPAAPRPAGDDATVCLWARGGRQAAVERLLAIDPAAYGRTRNHVDGAVTRLSPWLRHGVLSLAEVRDAALDRVDRPDEAASLVSELGWRDYWRRVQAALGGRVGVAVEPPARSGRRPIEEEMPADVVAGRTGMVCIDAFVTRLHAAGWLHNHERMWLAAWLVHARGVRWQAGADWMLSHLLDGDPASNHFSWQWVAGTFSAKPYIFNRENLETFTGVTHCRQCPVLGRCDLEGSYDELAARFFTADAPSRGPLRIRPAAAWPPWPGATVRKPLVWLTLDSASATSPAAAAFPDEPRLFVVDPEWLEEERPSLNRLVFLCECLADVPGVEIWLGDPRAVVPARAAAHGCDGVVLAETPCPRVRAAAAAIRQGHPPADHPDATALPVAVVPWPRFCDASRVTDLGRFSRYWSQVSRSALEPTRSSGAER